MKVAVHVLKGWPEDRLPRCAVLACGRDIANGQPYVLLTGTLKLTCGPCAGDGERLRATHQQGLAVEIARLPRAEQRKHGVAAPRRGRYIRKPKHEHRKAGHAFKYPPAPCAYCGATFQPYAYAGRAQKYCSYDCSIEGKITVGRPRKCPACDQMFVPKHGNRDNKQACCSRACARWWFPRRLRNPNPKPLMWAQSWGLMGCKRCGRSNRRHRGQGYCPACYRRYREAPPNPRKTEPNPRRKPHPMTIAS